MYCFDQYTVANNNKNSNDNDENTENVRSIFCFLEVSCVSSLLCLDLYPIYK